MLVKHRYSSMKQEELVAICRSLNYCGRTGQAMVGLDGPDHYVVETPFLNLKEEAAFQEAMHLIKANPLVNL